ncbi:MAG: hypothetical protein HQL85_19440, partial [Magnetococcales bacterium]|nr:hypothetical protein [Magnetococcales bacterium]
MVVRISIFKGYGDGTGTIMVIRYWMMVFMLLVPWSVFGAEEWFPPLVKDAKGRVPLVREALHFRACGDKAFVALVEGGWYWRHLETGKVVPLPQLDASLTRMDTDYFIGC